ncbi:MAG: hypothetical protein AB8B47_00630 [Roseobacter sp.]
MSDAFTQFEERLQSLEHKHKELARGYVAKLNPDGLITVEPKQQRRGGWTLLLLAVALGGVLFKAATLSIVGKAVYETRIDTLNAGTTFEKICAWVMQIDPFTEQVSIFLNGFL